MSERIELTKSDLIQQEKAMEEVRKLLLDRYPNRQPLAFTHSYGCQQNISDGEKIRGMLAEMGYGFTNQESEADCIIFNTCAVRENAEFRIYGNVGNLKRYNYWAVRLYDAAGACGEKNPGKLSLCGFDFWYARFSSSAVHAGKAAKRAKACGGN